MFPSRDKGHEAQAESGTHSSESSRPSASPGSSDLRRYPRHDVELEVTMESESNFYMGLTENLSEGGIFIATHMLKP